MFAANFTGNHMSLKNHPNFHAVKFVTDVSSSFYESLRGKFNPKNLPPDMSEKISEMIVEFSTSIETLVDEYEL